MVELLLKNRDLYDELRAHSISQASVSGQSSQCLLLYINKKILEANLTITNDCFEENLKWKISHFCSHLKSKWNSKEISRMNSKFLSKHASWLDLTFHLPSFSGKFFQALFFFHFSIFYYWTFSKCIEAIEGNHYIRIISEASISNSEHDLQIVSKSGRPQKIFSECTARTKRRRTEDLRASTSFEELVVATKTSLYHEGLKSAAELLGQYTENSKSESIEVARIIKTSKPAKLIVPYTPEEALAFILNTGMTKDAYMQTRLGAKQRNADIYPVYEKVLAAKKLCYPEGVIVTDCGTYTLKNRKGLNLFSHCT